MDKARYLQVIDGHRNLGKSHAALTELLYAPDCNLNAGVPVDHSACTSAKIDRVWQSLVHAFTDHARRIDILRAGRFNDNEWYCIRLQCRL